jgi:hypothetical protein
LPGFQTKASKEAPLRLFLFVATSQSSSRSAPASRHSAAGVRTQIDIRFSARSVLLSPALPADPFEPHAHQVSDPRPEGNQYERSWPSRNGCNLAKGKCATLAATFCRCPGATRLMTAAAPVPRGLGHGSGCCLR